jgi:hypothetical protein
MPLSEKDRATLYDDMDIGEELDDVNAILVVVIAGVSASSSLYLCHRYRDDGTHLGHDGHF